MRILTGFHSIEELLRSGKAQGRLLVSGSGPRIKSILLLAAKAGIRVEHTGAEDMRRIAMDNRGIVMETNSEAEETEVSLDEFIEKVGDKCLVIVLDHIEDPQNFGAVVRSADVFAADLVVVAKRRAAPLTDAAIRASAGAMAYVPVAQVTNLAESLRRLAEAGFWIYAADMEGTALPEMSFPDKTVLVLGNEGAGVSRLLSEICDGTVSIPMWGHVDSLNVSAAAAVLMYEYRRQRPR